MQSPIAAGVAMAGASPASSPAGLMGLLAAPRTDTVALERALGDLPKNGVPALLDRIAWHRIDGLAHRALERLGGEARAGWLFKSLKRRAQRCAAATLSQGLALAEVLEALDRHSIPVAVMRGLRTIELLYRDPGLRPFEDHDLLVLPADLDAARAAVGRLGFEEAAHGYFRRGGVFIDLHSDPLGARRRPTRDLVFPLRAAPILSRAMPGLVAGSPALLPEREDELILLGVHLVKHSFDRLVRIADVAHLLAEAAGPLKWDVVRHRAERSRTHPLLCRAAEAAALLGVEVPEALRAERTGPAERWLMTRVTALRPVPYTGEILMTLAARGAAARLRFVLDAVLPAGEGPRGAWNRTAHFPRRAAHLARTTLGQITQWRTGR